MIVQDTEVREVLLNQLVLDQRCQMRAEISWVAVQEYADEMESGQEFPPVIVYWKFGSKYFVADGFHRVHAAKKLKLKELRCEVRHGGVRDAMIYAAGCNTNHGVRRTNSDKRKAVLTLLNDREWRKWNSTEIARRCGVSANLVERIRETMERPGPEYRLQFNGRGELQYRRTESKEKRSERINQKSAKEDKENRIKCPYCGLFLPKGYHNE